MNRRCANTVCAITGAVSLLGIAGGLLKLLGYPGLAGLLAIARVPGIEINWDGVWLVVFIASAMSAIAMNFGSLRQWREGREAASQRNWNMNFCDAVTYLSYTSLFGTAWPEPDKTKASASALYEAARKGTIDIAGQYKGSTVLKKIPRHWFNGLTVFDLTHCAPHGMKNAFLLDTDKKTPAYSSLIVDRAQIQRTWPSKPIAFR